MNKVIIFSDSTCDLSTELIERYDIKTIPLYVNFGEESYRDSVDITTERLYELIEKKGELPKTAAPSPATYIEYFKPYIDEGYDIVFIGISSTFSSGYASACLAATDFPEGRVHVIDSQNLSSGIGLLVLKAAKFKEEGLSAAEIATKVTELVPKIKTAFVIDTLEYLYMGGRCSGMANLMSIVLKIKPIINVVDGKMIVGQKPRGIKKGYNLLLDRIYADKNNLDSDFVMVTHSMADDAAQYLMNELHKNINTENILETNAGCVISSHCGRGTIGILYITK